MAMFMEELAPGDKELFEAWCKKLHVNPHMLCDFKLTAALHVYSIDLDKFENVIENATGYDSAGCVWHGREGVSMEQVLNTTYGQEVTQMLMRVI